MRRVAAAPLLLVAFVCAAGAYKSFAGLLPDSGVGGGVFLLLFAGGLIPGVYAGAAPATINHEVKALARALSLSVEMGLLNHAPKLPLLPEQNARQGFFERAEFGAVLAAIEDSDLRDFCEWFFLTGMRPGEIRSLTWEGFDAETMTLRLHARDAKTGIARGLSLEGSYRKLIERRIAARRLGTNLIHRGGAPLGDFRKTWQAACVAAELGQQIELPNGKTRYVGKRLYDLRRTAVRNMVRAGVPERVAMEISGHRTRATFDRYNITSESDMREALVRTSAYVDSLPTKPAAAPLRRGRGPPCEIPRAREQGQNTDNGAGAAPCGIS
jgi:integrase